MSLQFFHSINTTVVIQNFSLALAIVCLEWGLTFKASGKKVPKKAGPVFKKHSLQ